MIKEKLINKGCNIKIVCGRLASNINNSFDIVATENESFDTPIRKLNL